MLKNVPKILNWIEIGTDRSLNQVIQYLIQNCIWKKINSLDCTSRFLDSVLKMKAYQALVVMFIYLVNGQKVRDMWYRSTEYTRVSQVWPDSCAFPCRAVDETYQSLEIGSVGKPCPNPLPLDYDLSHDISSGILVQKPCDLEEVCNKCFISAKIN